MADSADRTVIDARPLRSQQVPTPPADADGHVLTADASGSVVELSWTDDVVSVAVGDAVAAAAALTPLTDNTGVTPDRTLANVVAASAAAGEATAADLTTTNTALAVLEANVSDLADAVNDLIAALDGQEPPNRV